MSAGWAPFDGGGSLESLGTEGGRILADEEHVLGARITLEADCSLAPFAINCGLYGWATHTCLFETEAAARTQLDAMKIALVEILDLIHDTDADAKKQEIGASIALFVARFP